MHARGAIQTIQSGAPEAPQRSRTASIEGARTLAALAGLLLLLGWLARNLPPAPTARSESTLEILVGAKGPLLPTAPLGTGPERVPEVIRLGRHLLVADAVGEGLRSALWRPGEGLLSRRTYALARDEGEAHDLLAAIRAVPDGSLLVLASSGRLVPPSPSARTALARATAELRARSQPGNRSVESWALIALRLRAGWVPLAEGYSDESGVALAFTLSHDLESYEGFVGDHVIGRAPPERELFLHEELRHAQSRSPGVDLAPDAAVRARILPSIRMHPSDERDGPPQRSVSWAGVTLDGGSGFYSWVGFEDGVGVGDASVAFDLFLDDARVGGVEVAPGEPWKVLRIDLRPFAGRKVTLELRCTSRPGSESTVLWGLPVLFHGYTRDPREVWAEKR